MTPSKMLPTNETILRMRFPVVFARIMQAGEQVSPDCYYDEEGEKGSTLFIRRGENAFPAYGSRKPQRLIDRWFKNLNLTPESFYAVTGFGDGSHLRKFLSEIGPDSNLMAAEKDPAILRETLSRFDYSDLLRDERFYLGVGEPDDAFFRDLEAVALTGVREVDRVVFAPFYSLDETYYDRMRNEMVRQYLVLRPLMEVNVRTAINIQQNTFENLPQLASAPDVGALEGRFAEVPFILVGAGPSLDDSIDFLKAARKHAIIACSNSSYRKLVNSGVPPHFVVTADPLSPTAAGFQGVSVEDMTLIAPFSAYPEIIKKFQGRVITWSTLNPIVAALRARTDRKPGTPVLEKGTVSSCVLDLSRLFGCKKVLLVGQDMAIREDGKYYSEDTSYADSGAHYNATERVQHLPGNTLEKVKVESRLFVYLKTFQEFIALFPNVEYRNLAEYGALIEGAPYQTLDEALNWVSTGDSTLFDEALSELFGEKQPEVDLPKIFSSTIQYVKKVMEVSLSAAIQLETIPEKFADLNYANNKKVKALEQLAIQINSTVDTSEENWSILFEGKTKGELVNYRRATKKISGPNETWNSLMRNKEYYWALAEGCHWLLPLLEKHLSKEDALS